MDEERKRNCCGSVQFLGQSWKLRRDEEIARACECYIFSISRFFLQFEWENLTFETILFMSKVWFFKEQKLPILQENWKLRRSQKNAQAYEG